MKPKLKVSDRVLVDGWRKGTIQEISYIHRKIIGTLLYRVKFDPVSSVVLGCVPRQIKKLE